MGNLNRTHGYLIALCVAILLSAFYGCHAPLGEDSLSFTPTSEGTAETNPAALPSPSLPLSTPQSTPTVASCNTSDLYEVTTSPVIWLQWAADASRLFYRLQESGDYWAFDPEYCTQTRLTPQQRPREISEDPAQVGFELPEDLRPFQWSIAPSRASVVFFQSEAPPKTATPGPGVEVGEGLELKNNIFFLEKPSDQPTYLGSITGFIDDLVWFSDGSAVVISMGRVPGEAYLWSVDIENQVLLPVIPASEDFLGFQFRALSPHGERLLYSQEAALFLYDLQQHTAQKLPLELSGRDYHWFLSPDTLLIVDDFDTPLDFVVASYDLQNATLRRIYETPLRIHSVTLSPDKQYLAIRWDLTLDLFVLPLLAD